MSFLAPALLLGLAAAAIPPILHLLHRRRVQVVRFPALEFILRANRKTARRFRVKQLLLMAVRSTLLALLAFAVARPYLRPEVEASMAGGGGDGAVVVVLDATWPMAAKLDGEPLIDKARFAAVDLLRQAAGLAALTVAGDRVEVPIGELTGDLDAVRRAVEATKLSPRFGTLPEAVARAYELLVDVPGPKRVVVLTTAAGAVSNLPQPPAGGESGGITLVPYDVARGAPIPNRAILEVELRPAPELGSGSWRVDARVANYSEAPVKRLPMHLEVDGDVQVRGFLDLPAGGEATKTFYTRVEREAATQAAVALEPDALETDDRREFWLQPAPKLRVLAVNGEPHPVRHRDELFYLERALAPNTTAGARVQLTVSAVDTLDQHPFADFDVVVLANVRGWDEKNEGLRPEDGQALDAFVRGGGGLLVTVGDRLAPDRVNDQSPVPDFNALLGNLLPRALRDVRAGDAAASAQGGDRRTANPGVFERGHAILRPFADPGGSTLASARVRRYMLLDPSADAGGEVVVALDEGAPLLLTRAVDRGRVALLTTTIDRDWTDLPIRPDFVPLVQSTLRYLTRVADVDTTPVLVGAPAPIPVEDPQVSRVQIRDPAGQLHVAERPQQEGEPWAFEQTTLPGHYQVTPDPPLPGLVALPGFAVAVDPAGADLRGAKVDPGAPGDSRAGDVLTAGQRTELWHAALLGLFLMLVAEAGLLWKKRGDAATEDLQA